MFNDWRHDLIVNDINKKLKTLANYLHSSLFLPPGFGIGPFKSFNPFFGAVAIVSDIGGKFVGLEGDIGGFF